VRGPVARPCRTPGRGAMLRRHRQLPPGAGDRGQRGEASDLTLRSAGENRWPAAGRQRVRQRGVLMAVAGEF